MKKFAKKILDNRNRILTAAAAVTVVGVAALYMRDNLVKVTARDVARLNQGKAAMVFESHGSEFAIVPAWMLGKQAS